MTANSGAIRRRTLSARRWLKCCYGMKLEHLSYTRFKSTCFVAAWAFPLSIRRKYHRTRVGVRFGVADA
jgi:hypothetical protein